VHNFLGVGLQSSRTQRIDRQFHVLQHSCLNSQLSQSIVCLVDVSSEKLGCSNALLDTIHPNLDMLVFICHDLVRVCVRDGLETRSRLSSSLGNGE
jgi:hypothetical protein